MISIGSVHSTLSDPLEMTEPNQQENQSSPPELAVVVPVYNEAENLGPLITEIRAALDPVCGHYEIIYVDDGRQDQEQPGFQ